ncbi:T9SS type A sorting domain-containing protein [Pedobacter caeni]|uniref:Por secretion system C-terminal sorting domain-containing protein n=1 Tax=Pedobacter caeni TaxID=288992 RepID=A0A1M5EV14_9SPHI|nr:T9SS type A sorting domain-containing protein [Pedobacter caeni]SHF83037.1 Por secretion system C-terminal sorting domain-containing protein [Pedobacter caeni]
MNRKLRIALLLNILCIICMSVFCSLSVFAQKSDSTISNVRAKKIYKTPQIKANVPTYKPRSTFGYIPYNDVTSTKTASNIKQDKILTVSKVYPNPVSDQINLILRLDRESNLSVKIMDLLGNEVVTLSNERIPSGEQTKSYTIPNRLNSGIYFLKISSGSETIVKRISVL